MKRSVKIILSLVLIFIISFLLFNFVNSSHSDSIYKNNARTYYETIDFSSPESTSKAFIASWRSSDYITFYIQLHPKQQRALQNAYFRLDTHSFFSEKSIEINKTLEQNANMANIESMLDVNLYFDYLFNAAKQHNALPFSFGKNARIESISENGEQRIVTIETDSEPKQIHLYLQKVEISERWKIAYIQIPEFTSKSLLWGDSPQG